MKILVIEDEPKAAEYLRQGLSETGNYEAEERTGESEPQCQRT